MNQIAIIVFAIHFFGVAALDDGFSATTTPTLTSTATLTSAIEVQQSIEDLYRTIVVDYVHPKVDAATLYDADHLFLIKKFENELVNTTQYNNFCLRDSNSGLPAVACAPPQSVISIAFPANKTLSPTLLKNSLSKSQWRPCVGGNFPIIQNRIRSFFRFGGPLTGFSMVSDRYSMQNETFMKWFSDIFQPKLEALVSTYSISLNISFRGVLYISLPKLWDCLSKDSSFGGPFGYYESQWETYRKLFNISISNDDSNEMRFSLFKDNAKRIEYLSSLKPGTTPQAMYHPFMHLTNKEFFKYAFNLTANASKPSHEVFLMWNIMPDMSDYIYPP